MKTIKERFEQYRIKEISIVDLEAFVDYEIKSLITMINGYKQGYESFKERAFRAENLFRESDRDINNKAFEIRKKGTE